MSERLTKKISKTIQDKYSLGSFLYYDFAGIDDTNKLLNKLGKLEDIMEKHGIESVDELEKVILFSMATDSLIYTSRKLKRDRDIWKRVSELMGEEIKSLTEQDCPIVLCYECKFFEHCNKLLNEGKELDCEQAITDYFYTQAQKERKDEEL